MKPSGITLFLIPGILFFSTACSTVKTPILDDATNAGNTREVQRLLDKGYDPNVLTPTDGTPLHSAAKTGKIEIVEILLAKQVQQTKLKMLGSLGLAEI